MCWLKWKSLPILGREHLYEKENAMKIGIIGAGNIAQKAYFATYAALQNQHDFVIYSRDLAKAQALQAQYHFTAATSELAALYTCDLVFIHAATPVHYELAKDFLEHDCHVFMDKPISENLAEVTALLSLAEKRNLLFIVGFNRRFAPRVADLKAIADKNVITVTKNRVDTDLEVTYGLYDLFIHPLDTLVYLFDDAILKHQVYLKSKHGKLNQITLVIETATAIGIARLNAKSGANTESFVVEAPSGTYTVNNLTEYQIDNSSGRQNISFPDWDTTLYKRGFEPMTKAVLAQVASFDGTNRAAILRQLKQEQILETHAIIDEIVT
jgi:virulence factor